MNRNYVNANSMKTVLRNAFFAVTVLVCSSMAARAQAVQAAYTTPAVIAPVVTYLGSGDDQMSFNMKYDNASGGKFFVIVKDSEGEVMFNQSFKDKTFNKTFKVPADMGKLSFVVRDVTSKTEKKIEISTERRFVEEVSVTRVY